MPSGEATDAHGSLMKLLWDFDLRAIWKLCEVLRLVNDVVEEVQGTSRADPVRVGPLECTEDACTPRKAPSVVRIIQRRLVKRRRM